MLLDAQSIAVIDLEGLSMSMMVGDAFDVLKRSVITNCQHYPERYFNFLLDIYIYIYIMHIIYICILFIYIFQYAYNVFCLYIPPALYIYYIYVNYYYYIYICIDHMWRVL